MANQLVIFGYGNIVSDLFDAALANGLRIKAVVHHYPETCGERDRSLEQRLEQLKALGQTPQVFSLDTFIPDEGELYLLGPTTPTRELLADEITRRWGLSFTQLIHPTAYVSPLASLSPGVFVGANSVIGAGASLAPHVFVNRGVTIGHDTQIASFARLQPGSNLGGLSVIGRGVTVGLGATLLERLVIGEGAFIGAGAVVLKDVPPHVLMVGVPAIIKKSLI